MKEKLLKQIEKRLETMDEAIGYQIKALCELSSMIYTINHFLFLATHEKSKGRDLKLEQE